MRNGSSKALNLEYLRKPKNNNPVYEKSGNDWSNNCFPAMHTLRYLAVDGLWGDIGRKYRYSHVRPANIHIICTL
jgi:hypothetical protein